MPRGTGVAVTCLPAEGHQRPPTPARGEDEAGRAWAHLEGRGWAAQGVTQRTRTMRTGGWRDMWNRDRRTQGPPPRAGLWKGICSGLGGQIAGLLCGPRGHARGWRVTPAPSSRHGARTNVPGKRLAMSGERRRGAGAGGGRRGAAGSAGGLGLGWDVGRSDAPAAIRPHGPRHGGGLRPRRGHFCKDKGQRLREALSKGRRLLTLVRKSWRWRRPAHSTPAVECCRAWLRPQQEAMGPVGLPSLWTTSAPGGIAAGSG